MKWSNCIFMLLLSFCLLPSVSSAVNSKANIPSTSSEELVEEGKMTTSSQNNLTLKEKLLLPFFKKKAQKSKQNNPKQKRKGKRQKLALILCAALGLFGAHRFYLGYTGVGILYMVLSAIAGIALYFSWAWLPVLLGISGVGWVVDLVLLFFSDGLTPKDTHHYPA